MRRAAPLLSYVKRLVIPAKAGTYWAQEVMQRSPLERGRARPS